MFHLGPAVLCRVIKFTSNSIVITHTCIHSPFKNSHFTLCLESTYLTFGNSVDSNPAERRYALFQTGLYVAERTETCTLGVLSVNLSYSLICQAPIIFPVHGDNGYE